MLTRTYLRQLIEQNLISTTRVVPVPFEASWCIDVVVRVPLEAGSKTETVASADTDSASDRLRRFDSIDDAARFLREVGITTFTVDTADALSFAHVTSPAVRVVEKTMRLWQDEESAQTETSPAAA